MIERKRDNRKEDIYVVVGAVSENSRWDVSSEWTSGGAYLRPVRGCIRAGCEVAAAAAGCLGLLTFVLLFANSKRMVCGISGSIESNPLLQIDSLN